MKEIEKLTIVAPWGLSHYISLNGFRPLYRPLFDHISENIEINSLDNVKLHKKLSNDSESLKSILSEIEKEKLNHEKTSLTSLKEAYQNYFCGPNRVLTEKLPGDIEFHHTIPFPSMSRPFVFHCESFPPTNLPFMKDGCSQNKELKEYYKYIFSHDYCLGIFTHIPETLEKIKSLFDDPVITKKLYSSKIGLSKKHYDNVDPSTKSPISNPTLLFINSDYQNPEGFIKRGGHLVLRFWKKFIKSGKTGLLILRSAPPSIKELKALSVDTEFVKSEFGKSIIWFKGYLNNYEINRLVLRSNFLIQPNSLLHSVHTMQAMRLGTVPVVSDMPGADTYISNGKNGIILEGLNPALENQDTKSGISSCDAAKISDTNDKLLSQMTYEIFTLLENKDMYQTTSNQAIKTAISQFSGENFSTNFWNKVTELYMEKNYQPVPISAENDNLLDNCLIDKDNWDRFFESPSQPVQKIHTGKNTVYEFGGSFVQTFGKHEMNPNNWSVLSQYLTDTKIGFSLSPSDLEGKYIYKHSPVIRAPKVIVARKKNTYKVDSYLNYFSKKLKDYLRSTGLKFFNKGTTLNIELLKEGIRGFNIIRYYHLFYAVPQNEGMFTINKVREKKYSKQYSSLFYYKLVKIVRKNHKHSPLKHYWESPPRLVFENFHGFNIIEHLRYYYGINQQDGPFDLSKVQNESYTTFFKGNSLAEVKKQIITYIKNK